MGEPDRSMRELTRPGGRAVALSVAMLGVLAIATGGMTRGPATSSAAVDLAPARGDATLRARGVSAIAWRPCGERLQCARVRMPLNWDHPSRGSISLPVIRHLATRPEQRLGSLFVNAGGATGSVAAVRTDGAKLDALTGGRFDVVGWALRGTAGSSVVRCFRSETVRGRFWQGLPIPTTPAQSERYVPKTVGFARRCGRLNSDLLAHLSTADDARDLDRLRALVGDRRLTYQAVSYGTFLGQTYANLFPDRVRAMALDGLVDPRIVTKGAEARFANTVSKMDAGLRIFTGRCQAAGPAACALAGSPPAGVRVARLLSRLQRAPIPAPAAQPSGALQYGDALTALFVSLTNPAAWPQLATDLASARHGDGSALATLARGVLAGVRSAAGDPTSAITCTDSPARHGPRSWPRVIRKLTSVSAIGGPFVGWASWAPCASWPARAHDRYTGPWDAETANPILLIGTRFDPATPYANARRVARLLPRSVLLTHDGYGHTSEADPSSCVERATRRYLVRLVTPAPGSVCRSERQPFEPAP